MRWLGVLVALLFAHAGAAAKDVPLALFKSFAGNVNFTGTQETLRNKGNSLDACSVSSASTTRSARLSVPSGAKVLAAHLYWAGSGKTADNTVTFEGKAITAPDNRRYSSNTNGGGFDYFGGAADVTAIVAAKGSGDYDFSGLTVANGKPFCASQAVVGGFSLLVVYSHWLQPFRVLNLFEGFQYVQGGEVTLEAGNFEIPKRLWWWMTGRLGHITWEGDASLAYNGEMLKFNGDEMTDDYNPSGNQFNSKSNINDDSRSYGIDFDAYDVGYPTIKPGQTTAKTIYRTGQDLVLLNAEIIAVPNVPTSDLDIRIARNGELIVGRNASYTLSVRNDGPRSDAGPIVVTQTVPAGMSYVSGLGTGWSCSAVSQVISCTNAGPLAVGAALPPLTIAVLVNAAGPMTTTASVDGTFDNVLANNTASDSATAVAPPSGGFTYVFTAAPCKVGEQCPRLDGSIIAGQEIPIWVTAVGGPDMRGVAVDPAAQKVVRMSFALTCENPGTGAPVTVGQPEPGRKYAGVALPACTGGGKIPDATATSAWSPMADLVFDAGVPSARIASGAAQFLYEDVGKLKLSMMDEAKQRFSSDPFVSMPWRLGFMHIRRAVDGVGNPGATDGAGLGFARAGEALQIGVGAALYNNPTKFALNFGRENENTGPVIKVDVTKPISEDAKAAMSDVPGLKGSFTPVGGGVFSGAAFSWPEAGIAQMTPWLGDYLERGRVDGVPRAVGRFYPAYFKTVVAAAFQCQPKMNCPTQEGRIISGAVYSGQPFEVSVSAFAVNGEELKNFRGVFVPASGIRLAAAEGPGASATNPPALKGVFENATIAAVDKAATSVTASPTYLLPNPFAAASPRAQNWTAPTPIYIRAWIEEQVSMGGKPAEKREVSSDRDADSVEDGVMVVSGRMKVANAFGSELLKTPVRLEAQYWTGGAWQLNAGYDDPTELGVNGVGYTRCLGKLIKSGAAAPNNCNGDLLKPVGTALVFKLGAGTFWLAAPGKGNQGSVFLQLARPSWLPGSVGRVVLGTYSSPLIYTRELY
jgi:MSHA biogenesis protein MshQ